MQHEQPDCGQSGAVKTKSGLVSNPKHKIRPLFSSKFVFFSFDFELRVTQDPARSACFLFRVSLVLQAGFFLRCRRRRGVGRRRAHSSASPAWSRRADETTRRITGFVGGLDKAAFGRITGLAGRHWAETRRSVYGDTDSSLWGSVANEKHLRYVFQLNN